jgi:hypothetical protein
LSLVSNIIELLNNNHGPKAVANTVNAFSTATEPAQPLTPNTYGSQLPAAETCHQELCPVPATSTGPRQMQGVHHHCVGHGLISEIFSECILRGIGQYRTRLRTLSCTPSLCPAPCCSDMSVHAGCGDLLRCKYQWRPHQPSKELHAQTQAPNHCL